VCVILTPSGITLLGKPAVAPLSLLNLGDCYTNVLNSAKKSSMVIVRRGKRAGKTRENGSEKAPG
jgi:hypothetical protein